MNALRDLAIDCSKALVAALPIEDVWFLEASAARECGLKSPANLILVVPDDSQPHVVERAALDLIRKQPDWNAVDVFSFPVSAVSRTPRPLLLKMALSSGRIIYSK
jgi:hypothetical protein